MPECHETSNGLRCNNEEHDYHQGHRIHAHYNGESRLVALWLEGYGDPQ